MSGRDPGPFLREVGRRVTELADANGRPRVELADAAGLSVEWLAGIEAGAVDADLVDLYGLADALGVPLADLLS